MATAARTTGAEAQTEELRRRNVASQSTAAPVVAQAPSKEKSKEKVRLNHVSDKDAFGKLLMGQLGDNGTMG
jgi:hypothetical protein